MQWQTYTLSFVARLSHHTHAREVTEIAVVVLAFKAACTLKLKRRKSDKKIIALYGEMKDMMGVLLM